MRAFTIVVSCFLLLVLASASCENTNTTVERYEFLNAPATPGDTLFASIERGACFGRCPIYKIHVYHSGFVEYEAIKWNDEEGLFKGMLSEEKMKAIAERAKSIGYFAMDDEYDNTGVTDLPATYSEVNAYGNKKRIKNRYNGPEELRAFEKFIESQFDDMEWKVWKAESNGQY